MKQEEEDFSEEIGITHQEGKEASAFLIGLYSGSQERERCLEHLDELESLADTFGVMTKVKKACPIRKIEASTLLSMGKLQEITEEMAATDANLVIFDDEISPAQQRNLEKILKRAVMDRTELILEIFAQRARTKEARLQIELAKTKYQFPRLKRLWSHFSRQRARGGYLKGEGEKQIEIDRRLLKRKLERLNAELTEVKKARETQKSARRRQAIPTFAIIGYTNAGKSTLLNALTEADVFVEDKLFATLDPTTRKYTLPNNQEVLLTDTVGFIRKLPHTLVAAFSSTLEAALQDDVLIHLIDVSNPRAEEQSQTTRQLLKELKAHESGMITVLNKVDACTNRQLITRLKILFPNAVEISALQKSGFQDLAEAMMKAIASMRQIVKFKISQKEYGLVALVRREGKVLYEEYDENDIIMRAEIPVTLLDRLSPYLI